MNVILWLQCVRRADISALASVLNKAEHDEMTINNIAGNCECLHMTLNQSYVQILDSVAKLNIAFVKKVNK